MTKISRGNLVESGRLSALSSHMRGLLLLLAIVACDNPFDLYQPKGEPFTPPAIYREWYARVESCSRLKGAYEEIHFQHAYDLRDDGHMYAGYWYPRHTITIRDDYLSNERVVSHEFMHDLLQDGHHPAQYFNNVCGNLIGS